MKRIIYILLCTMLLIGQVTLASAVTAKVVIAPNWNRNKAFTYQYSIVTKNYENSVLENEKFSKGLIVNRRVCKEEEGFIFELQYSNPESNDPQFNNPIMKKFMENAIKQKVLYKVGKKGSFMGIQNLTEIQKLIEVDVIDSLCQSAGKNDEKIQQLKTNLKNMLLTREFIESTYTEETKNLCDLYGMELELNAPLELEVELPNILDGPSYPARCVVVLKEFDQASGIYKGEIKTTPLPGEFARITTETLKKLFGKEIDPKLTQQLSLSVQTSFEYDSKRKIITKICYIKDITNQSDRKTVETTLELVAK